MNDLLLLLSNVYNDAQQKLGESIIPLRNLLNENKLGGVKLNKHFETLNSVIHFINAFVNDMSTCHTNDMLNMFDCCERAKSFHEPRRQEKKNNILPPSIYVDLKDRTSEENEKLREDCKRFFSNVRMHKLVALIPHILYENALKYSPQGNAGLITTKFSMSGHNKGIIQVSNLGPHVTAEETARIFESGYRGRNAQQAIPDRGFGLGLNFVKEIINSYGGNVEAKSSDNLTKYNNIPYSQFTITIAIDGDKTNNSPSINTFNSARTLFLHEYNHILTSLHIVVENITKICEHFENITADLSQYLDDFENATYYYELSLMKYVYALDKSFIQFSSPTHVEIKKDFIDAINYFKDYFMQNGISVDAKIIQKGHFRLLDRTTRFSIYDSRAESITINAVEKVRDIPLLILDFISQICLPNEEITITLTPDTIFNQRRLNVEITFSRKLGITFDNLSETAPTEQCTLEYINYILENNRSAIISAENIEDDKIRIEFDL